MNFRKGTRYALYAAMEMARSEEGRPVTAAQVAARYGVAAAVLSKVFQQLVRAGLAVGTRGVNGGYVAGSQTLTTYLREKGPMYIYSNPITPGEAAAAEMAVSVLDSAEGSEMLDHLREMTGRFESGLVGAGFDTIPGPHPIVPLMMGDAKRTASLVHHLFDNGVLATGLNFPVVPKGDEEIRFQVNADHTVADIDSVLSVLSEFVG